MSLLLRNTKDIGKKHRKRLRDKWNWAEYSELMNPGEGCTSVPHAILTHFIFAINSE